MLCPHGCEWLSNPALRRPRFDSWPPRHKRGVANRVHLRAVRGDNCGTASTNPFQYTGRENDATGLYNYRARYYSPSLRRFISEDPLKILGEGVNLYSYVGSNPINFVDRLGLRRECGYWENVWSRFREADFFPGVRRVFWRRLVWVSLRQAPWLEHLAHTPGGALSRRRQRP